VSTSFVPAVPKSPESYASIHKDRIEKFPERKHFLLDPYDPEIVNKDQSQGWAHELDHDVESVFWLLVYWAVVAQPKDHSSEYIRSTVWTLLIGNCKERDVFIGGLAHPGFREGLTHSAYEPLRALIGDLALFLVVDRCWLPTSDPRNDAEYLNEAFQRCILQFIIDHRHENFMNCAVGTTLRTMEEVPQSQAPSSTRSQDYDAAERNASLRHYIPGSL
jgi:hypothetical protein